MAATAIITPSVFAKMIPDKKKYFSGGLRRFINESSPWDNYPDWSLAMTDKEFNKYLEELTKYSKPPLFEMLDKQLKTKGFKIINPRVEWTRKSIIR